MHVHVLGPDGEAKFWLEPTIDLAVNYGLSARQLARIERIVEERQRDLINAWNSHFGT